RRSTDPDNLLPCVRSSMSPAVRRERRERPNDLEVDHDAEHDAQQEENCNHDAGSTASSVFAGSEAAGADLATTFFFAGFAAFSFLAAGLTATCFSLPICFAIQRT